MLLLVGAPPSELLSSLSLAFCLTGSRRYKAWGPHTATREHNALSQNDGEATTNGACMVYASISWVGQGLDCAGTYIGDRGLDFEPAPATTTIITVVIVRISCSRTKSHTSKQGNMVGHAAGHGQ